MGDYDSPVDEELFKRILQIVHRDASGELHNLLTKLAATHEHGTSASKLITENTFFVAFAKRNLLHVATYNQARNCVRLLVNPPHCWDPDKLDGRNHNPMYLAEQRDDIGVLVEIARRSKERRDICSPSVDKPIYGGFPSTALVWPQDLWVHPLKRDAVSYIFNERNLQSNYVQLVRSLRQPQSIEQFLIYQDIWDVPDWEQHLTDGEGANMPYGIRLLAKRIVLDTGETGTQIGHRFIPDR
ncbi:hypothetical protein CRM22_001774 [Opisthorchis felineus]|uniref:Uncharacterized protein n=1 Tax=Opisthorchis felineus TaxID=147828 RepID=A0A4S2MFG0_OPIFE|nr:hypothetical protein CRM22_001774 [Opisthorchis felineus]